MLSQTQSKGFLIFLSDNEKRKRNEVMCHSEILRGTLKIFRIFGPRIVIDNAKQGS